MIRALVADPHPPTRVAVAAALSDHGWTVCAQVETAADAVAAALAERPDLCVVDVDLPGDGVAAIAAIDRDLPDTAIVVFTSSETDEHLFGALDAGVRGYLLKETSSERLAIALQAVLEGEAAMQRRLASRVLREFRRRSPDRPAPHRLPGGEQLSPREWSVLELLGAGQSTHDVAQTLAISDVTVRRHVSAVVRKLGLPDRAAAIELAARALR